MTKINNRRHTHTVPETQRESWKLTRNSKTRQTQVDRVLTHLTNHKANSRQITNALNIERNSMTRILTDLKDSGRVRVVYEATCSITGRMTQFYEAVDNEAETIDKAPTSEGKFLLIDLFAPESHV